MSEAHIKKEQKRKPKEDFAELVSQRAVHYC